MEPLALWLLVVTAISIAALVISGLALFRVSRRPSPPPQYGLIPPGRGPAPTDYPLGPTPTYPPQPIAEAPPTWMPRSRCAELNITD